MSILPRLLWMEIIAAGFLAIYFWHQASLVASFISAMVAGLVGIVSYAQWKTAEESRKQKLFDKRFEIYEEVIKYFYGATDHDAVKLKDISFRLAQLTNKVRFLFDDNVYQFVDEMRKLFLKQSGGKGKQDLDKKEIYD